MVVGGDVVMEMGCGALEVLFLAENARRYPEDDGEQSILSAELAARSLEISFGTERGLSSSLEFGQQLQNKMVSWGTCQRILCQRLALHQMHWMPGHPRP